MTRPAKRLAVVACDRCGTPTLRWSRVCRACADRKTEVRIGELLGPAKPGNPQLTPTAVATDIERFVVVGRGQQEATSEPRNDAVINYSTPASSPATSKPLLSDSEEAFEPSRYRAGSCYCPGDLSTGSQP
jgi:hypothetical protein